MTKVEWRKASRSSTNGGNCVEVASVAGAVAVRDSKNPEGAVLAFSRAALRRFAEDLRKP